MKILVAVKRVVDYAAKVRVKPDKSGVDVGHVKMSMNPFCEIGLEEALRVRQHLSTSGNPTVSVVAVSVGGKGCEDTLRTALAMGADRGVHVVTGTATAGEAGAGEPLQPLAVASLLKAVVQREKPMLVFLGKQAIDDDCNQTGQMMAAMLGWPQGTFASKVGLNMESGIVSVTREIDGGLEKIDLKLPAVITTDLRLNEPRYATLPNIMKAKKKTIDKLNPDELQVEVLPQMKTIEIAEPVARKGGKIMSSVDELIGNLKQHFSTF